jgi:hypothetical protein
MDPCHITNSGSQLSLSFFEALDTDDSDSYNNSIDNGNNAPAPPASMQLRPDRDNTPFITADIDPALEIVQANHPDSEVIPLSNIYCVRT